MRFRHGDAEAPLKVVGPAPAGKKGTRVTFLPSPDTFKIIEFDFEHARAPLPRARLPQFGRPPDPRRRAPRGAERASSFIMRAGSPPSSAISTAPRRR